MESLIPSAKDNSSDVMVKYIVLGIILIVLFVAVKYVLGSQFTMIEGLVGRGDKNKPGEGGPLDDENDGDIITIAKRQEELASKTQKSLNMDEHYNHYSQIIDNMDEWVNAKIVNSLKNVSREVHGEGKMEDIVRHMNELNTMNKFKLTLEDCSRYIDTK
jgi:hypothetical protein